MNALSVHREAIGTNIQILEMIMTDVTPEQAHWLPQGTAHSVAATYAHAALGTDWQINSLFQRSTPLFAGEWAGKTGVSEPRPDQTLEWAKTVKVDLPTLRQYVQAVYANALAFVDSLTEADLERKIDLSFIGFGEQTLGWCLSALVAGHLRDLCGEIATVKGLQGLKGYPSW
ncbi:MAG: hypothetical protein Fur0044_13270 [Anaerolineae bacterium]